ncbi:WD40 repeat domain-containing protein [Gorillibacterium timonense]|uniref:hypothetical protein n=1 Tax=Gorillibacterium timonense TaxID=1689269 RepID=UPI00071D17F0|nr:hypothetical protein [Gorillibacterium timonense]
MPAANRKKAITVWLLIVILLGSSALLVLNMNHRRPIHSAEREHSTPSAEVLPVQTRSSVVGLLSDQKNGSDMVSYDTSTWEPTVLLHLPAVTPDNYAALSSDGKYAAYTTWDDQVERRYLNIYTFATGKTESFYQDMPLRNEIIKLSWLPDNQTLVFIQNDATTSSYQEIKTFDIATREEKVLVRGEVWRVRTVEDKGKTADRFYLKGKQAYLSVKEKKDAASYQKDDPIQEEEWNYYLNQTDLDEIYHEFGGKGKFDIEKVPTMMNVGFSAPRVSDDGTKLIYSAVLDRSSAPGAQTPLWMCASIWLYDLKSGQTSIVYSQEDGGSIGRVDWLSDDEICFISYYDFQGSRDSVNTLRLSTQEHRVVFPYSDEHYNNTTLLPVGNRQITFTSSQKGDIYEQSKTILLNADTGSYRELDVKMGERQVLLDKFIHVKKER